MPLAALIRETFNLTLIQDLPLVEEYYHLSMKKLKYFAAWAARTRFQDGAAPLNSALDAI